MKKESIRHILFGKTSPRAIVVLLSSLLILGCTDDLDISGPQMSNEWLRFIASLDNDSIVATTRSTAEHLEVEEELWMVDAKKEISTRGLMTTLMDGDVGVSAFEGSSSALLFSNHLYTFNGDELITEVPTRWSTIRDNASIVFSAYAPYVDSYDSGNSFSYTVPQNISEQKDIIAAKTTISPNKDGDNDVVRLTFEHVLTAVRFRIGFACTVKSVKVENIYNKGTFSLLDNRMTADKTSFATYTIDFGSSGKLCDVGDVISPDDGILMMIPQKLVDSEGNGKKAKITLTYDNDQQLIAYIGGKTWNPGKLITYTLYREAPTYIYFDLAAGNVVIDDGNFSGKVYVNGSEKEISGSHVPSNVYYVYQSSTNTGYPQFGPSETGYASDADFDKGTCRIPAYLPVSYNGQPWSDYITNNTSVEDVIEVWDDGKEVREDKIDAPDENHIGTKVVRDVGRTHTRNYIKIVGENTKYNLTIDNIYSVIQQPVNSSNSFRNRSVGGICYMPTGGAELTVNLVGDNRMGCLHIHNTPTDRINIQGTGSLTAADADFLTVKDVGDYKSDFGDTEGYISNFWNSAIGNNTNDKSASEPYNENVYNLYVKSGIIFAGATKTEDCTAIGGGGNGSGQVFITGGVVTAVATTAGTAIGGGMGHTSHGGPGEVYISGGNVYAYNFANQWNIPSSAIGGGGSQKSSGQEGTVNITGGYVYAYSAIGTAIGGGSSSTLAGGNANITISSGQVIAKSGRGAGIGGGSSCTDGKESGTIYNGGTATIKISGNPIVRTGSIGGGTTGDPKGKLGSADITISGGDIQAQFVMEAGAKSTPKFTMTAGTIRNSDVNDAEYRHTKHMGGAVYMEDGSFTMKGGTIKNCYAQQGGAVYIKDPDADDESVPIFTMTGGVIEYCASATDGGAIYMNGGEAYVNGSAYVNNNIAQGGNGGGICIEQGNFEMAGAASIMYNTALFNNDTDYKKGGNGGGVYVSSSTADVDVDLLSGSIMHNTSDRNGGGIHVDMGSSSKVANIIVGGADSGPDIEHNHTILEGGGLYANGSGAAITFNNGTIQYNTVSGYVDNPDVANNGGMVTLNGGTVKHIVVTFEGNKGYIIVDGANRENTTQKIVTNTNSKLMAPTPNRAGWTFTGWNDRPDGLGNTYTNGQILNRNTDLTLYAQWELGQ